ncbi:MAG: ABC transporter substrate-binding protein, partial [Oceanobacter sp.]
MRAIWIALSLWLFSNSGWADIQPPEDVIKQAAGNILTVLEQDRRLIEDHPQYLYQTLLDELMPISNDYLIGKKVLGKYWKRLSAAQRERFKSGYRNKMLATYEAVLRRYDDQKVIYKPAVIEDDKHYARVDSIVIRPGKEPFLISYRLSFSRDKWRLFDVIMDGVSMNAATRDQLREEIKESGLSQTISRLYKDHPDPRQELVFGVSIWEPYVDPQLSGHGPIPSLITGIYSKLGYKVKMLIQPGQRLLDGIKNDTLDGLMVVWNPQQMTGMKFTQPYLTSSLSLVKRESDSHKYSLKGGLLANEHKARLGVHEEASNALP